MISIKILYNNQSYTYIVGLTVALVFGILSIHFSNERALNFDSAYYLFHLLHQQSTFFPNGRFPAALPQLPVIAAQQLSLSLKSIFILYSLSAFFLPWLAALYFLLRKDKRWFAATVLSILLFQSHAFLYPISDFRSGLPWLLLWAYSLRAGAKIKFFNACISALLLIPVIWSHPLMMIPIGFVWMLRLFNNSRYISRNDAMLFSINLIIIAARLVVFNTAYENEKLQLPSAAAFLTHFIPSLNIPGGLALLPEWCALFLLLLLPASAFARFLLLLSFCGSLSLIIQTGQAVVWDQYADHLLTGTAAIMGIYAAHFMNARHMRYVSAALLMLLMARSIQIYQYAAPARQRLQLYQNWIDQCRSQNIKHAWIACDDCDWPLWDSFYQTLLLSASNGKPVNLFVSRLAASPEVQNTKLKGWYDGGNNWNLQKPSRYPLPVQDDAPLQFLVGSSQQPILKQFNTKP